MTKINYRWDAQPGANEGWYGEVFVGGELAAHSEQFGFPVDCSEFAEDEEDDLVEALQEEFPAAEIVRK